FRATVARGIRQIAFLLIPASVVCAVLAEPIVRVVYQHGDFTAGQTPATAGALAAFSLGLAFYGVGIWGLPLATSLGNIACSAALFVLLRRRLGRIEMGETIRTVVRVTAASAVLAGVAYGLWWLIDRGLGDSLGPALVAVLVALAGGLGAYVVSCRALGVRELEALLALGRRPA